MKLFFNVVGTLLFLAALYFGYFAVKLAAFAHDSFGQPSGDVGFAWSAYTAGAMGGVALLFLIGAGIFLGVAEIIATIERASRRLSGSEPEPDVGSGQI